MSLGAITHPTPATRDEFASEKIRDEWKHFAALLGVKAAARRLAQVYGVDVEYALRVGEGTKR